MALQAVEVEAGAAVADVTVGPNQVVGAVAGAEPGQGGPVRVAERGLRGGLAAEPVNRDQVPVACLQPRQPLLVPCARGAAEQQLERGRVQGVVQAAGNPVGQHR